MNSANAHGAGKSTTMRLILGLDSPTGGIGHRQWPALPGLRRAETNLWDACGLNPATREGDEVIRRCIHAPRKPEPLKRHKPGIVRHALYEPEDRERVLNELLRDRDSPGPADRDLGNHTAVQPCGRLQDLRLFLELERGVMLSLRALLRSAQPPLRRGGTSPGPIRPGCSC